MFTYLFDNFESRSGLAVRRWFGKRKDLGSAFLSFQKLWFVDTVLWLCPSLPSETLKCLPSLPILMHKSFWWWQCSDRYILSIFPHLHTPFPPPSPSLISLKVSVDVKHHVYLLTLTTRICGRTVGLMDSLADEALGLSALISFAHHTYGPCSEVGVESLRSRCAEH